MQPETIADGALTIAQFCQWAGISAATFHRHRQSMPATTRFGRSVRITPAALRAWEAEQLKRDRRKHKAG